MIAFNIGLAFCGGKGLLCSINKGEERVFDSRPVFLHLFGLAPLGLAPLWSCTSWSCTSLVLHLFGCDRTQTQTQWLQQL